MTVHVSSECNGISYSGRFREYGIVRSMPDTSVCTLAVYCPWCGTKLPVSMRGKYFKALASLGLSVDILTPLSEVPDEYRDDRWWQELQL